MSDFGEIKHPVARKSYRCEWCFAPIPKGEQHAHFAGVWEGDWQNWRMHSECHEAASEGEIQDGFTPGTGEIPPRVAALMSLEAN